MVTFREELIYLRDKPISVADILVLYCVVVSALLTKQTHPKHISA